MMMSQPRRAPGLLRDNGLLLACLGLFAIFFAGMIISGTASYNQEQQETRFARADICAQVPQHWRLCGSHV
jgi:hypothetical protein